jgi:phosphopantothenoylcysteine synthetase/decarboxylase
MKILVTAGNTQAPVDQVRCLTNIFTGRTGAGIALAAHRRGHAVALLTSHPEAIAEAGGQAAGAGWEVEPYRTFDDLQAAMEGRIRAAGLDVVIHCAAVSDYLCAGVYAADGQTRFDPTALCWTATGPDRPRLVDRQAGKVKSDEAELWLRLVRAPKLVDRVRTDWGFRGTLIKFKLEVGTSDERLLEIAEASRRASHADLMVANTLEGASSYAFLGPLGGAYQRISRSELPERLLDTIERLRNRSERKDVNR